MPRPDARCCGLRRAAPRAAPVRDCTLRVACRPRVWHGGAERNAPSVFARALHARWPFEHPRDCGRSVMHRRRAAASAPAGVDAARRLAGRVQACQRADR